MFLAVALLLAAHGQLTSPAHPTPRYRAGQENCSLEQEGGPLVRDCISRRRPFEVRSGGH